VSSGWACGLGGGRWREPDGEGGEEVRFGLEVNRRPIRPRRSPFEIGFFFVKIK